MGFFKRALLALSLLAQAALGLKAQAPAEIRLAPSEAKAIVQTLVDRKLAAMKAKDMDAYLALLGDQEKEYLVEQRNWFLIYEKSPVSDFATSVEGVKVIDPNTLVATLRDTYYFGTENKDVRDATYDKVFRKTESGWKDCDLDFEQTETEHFIIKFPSEAKRVVPTVEKEAEKGYSSITQIIGMKPADKTIIKMYATRELVRHTTDISVEWVGVGWYEYGESIKFFAYPKNKDFARVVAHELTHKLSLGITDSMATWLAEGLAESYGSYPVTGESPLKSKWFPKSDLAQPLNWLVEHKLWTLNGGRETWRYYAMSGLVVEFLRNAYGEANLKALLQELARNPRYNRGFDPPTMEDENQRRTAAAIRTVYGVSWEDLSQSWLSWISKQG